MDGLLKREWQRHRRCGPGPAGAARESGPFMCSFLLLISLVVTASILVPPEEDPRGFPSQAGREYKAIYSSRISSPGEGYIKLFSWNTPRTLEAFILYVSSVLDRLLELAGSSRWSSLYLLHLPRECSQFKVCSNAFYNWLIWPFWGTERINLLNTEIVPKWICSLHLLVQMLK